MKDLSVIAISAVSSVVVGFIVQANGSQGAIVGMFFFLASLFFWGRLFAGEPLKVLWLLLVTMAIAGLPIVLKSDGAAFLCVLTTGLLLTVDQLVLSKIQRKPIPRWTGEEPGAVWDADLDRRNQELVNDYERSNGALVFDDQPSTKGHGSCHHR